MKGREVLAEGTTSRMVGAIGTEEGRLDGVVESEHADAVVIFEPALPMFPAGHQQGKFSRAAGLPSGGEHQSP